MHVDFLFSFHLFLSHGHEDSPWELLYHLSSLSLLGDTADCILVTHSSPSPAPMSCDSTLPPTGSGVQFPTSFIYVGLGHTTLLWKINIGRQSPCGGLFGTCNAPLLIQFSTLRAGPGWLQKPQEAGREDLGQIMTKPKPNQAACKRRTENSCCLRAPSLDWFSLQHY